MIIVKKFKPHPPMMADRGGEAGSFEPYRNRYRYRVGLGRGERFPGDGGHSGTVAANPIVTKRPGDDRTRAHASCDGVVQAG